MKAWDFMRKFFLILTWVLLGAFYFGTLFLGVVLEPFLEAKLTALFDMPVTIEGLRANPWTGDVRASGIQFSNPPFFSGRPHLKTGTVVFRIDFPALLEREVRIETVVFEHPFYLIERIDSGFETITNIKTWIRHIKTRKKKPSSGPAKKTWQVDIQKIVLRHGTFIYQDFSHEINGSYFVFSELDGFLRGFHWPAEDPAVLAQHVEVRGVFGETFPAPFEIKGNANFATRHVGFDLEGKIPDGDVREHKRLWEGLAVTVEQGRFALDSHSVCLKRDLKSDNALTLKSLEVVPAPSAAGKLWGIPTQAAIGFLQEQEAVQLKIPVYGNIEDPKFDVAKAFRDAFQEALRRNVVKGVKLMKGGTTYLAKGTIQMIDEAKVQVEEGTKHLTEGASEIMGQTQDQLKETTEKIAKGTAKILGKTQSQVTEGVATIKDLPVESWDEPDPAPEMKEEQNE